MKRLAVGLALAAFVAAPAAYAECAFNHMAMTKAKTAKPMSVAKVQSAPEEKFDVASIPVDAWLIKYLAKDTAS
jgi:hypothetical protein